MRCLNLSSYQRDLHESSADWQSLPGPNNNFAKKKGENISAQIKPRKPQKLNFNCPIAPLAYSFRFSVFEGFGWALTC